jgi:hypothetical protein
MDFLRVISNSIGTSMEEYCSYQIANTYTIVSILVTIDLHEGLTKEIILEGRNMKHNQYLDYVGIMFICPRRHAYHLLANDYALGFSKNVLVRKLGDISYLGKSNPLDSSKVEMIL